jgi:hypothetical protein
MNMILESRDCQPLENVPADYCRKLKSGLARLEEAIQTHYETIYPAARELIARAVQEAEEASWATPFPSLFFPTLAHLKVREMIPLA